MLPGNGTSSSLPTRAGTDNPFLFDMKPDLATWLGTSVDPRSPKAEKLNPSRCFPLYSRLSCSPLLSILAP